MKESGQCMIWEKRQALIPSWFKQEIGTQREKENKKKKERKKEIEALPYHDVWSQYTFIIINSINYYDDD